MAQQMKKFRTYGRCSKGRVSCQMCLTVSKLLKSHIICNCCMLTIQLRNFLLPLFCTNTALSYHDLVVMCTLLAIILLSAFIFLTPNCSKSLPVLRSQIQFTAAKASSSLCKDKSSFGLSGSTNNTKAAIRPGNKLKHIRSRHGRNAKLSLNWSDQSIDSTNQAIAVNISKIL